MFTRALHWSLSWARTVQSTPLHPMSFRSVLIWATHLRLGRPSCLFPSIFPTEILCYVPGLVQAWYMPCSSHPPWLDVSNLLWFSSLCNFLQSPVTSSLFSPNNPSLQHSVLKNPSYSSIMSETKMFTPIQNQSQNYSFVCSKGFVLDSRLWTEFSSNNYDNISESSVL
jgi:hypothetical protein